MAHRRAWRASSAGLKYAFFAVLAVMLAAGLIGSFLTPLGIGGFFLMLVAMAVLFFGILGWPQAPEPTPRADRQDRPSRLPAQTERWLEAQRPALPAPAQTLADQIGIKLEAMAPQFARLDPQEPAAYELRKLVAEELPELVEGYRRVPDAMRREPRNGGASPDKQLIDGLRVVDEELLRMSEQMASGDLDKLATQGRYLELKYRGEVTARRADASLLAAASTPSHRDQSTLSTIAFTPSVMITLKTSSAVVRCSNLNFAVDLVAVKVSPWPQEHSRLSTPSSISLSALTRMSAPPPRWRRR